MAEAQQGGGVAQTAAGKEQRWTSQRKVELVLRVLKGESAKQVAEGTGTKASELEGWRDQFVTAGREGLKGSAAAGNGAGKSSALKRAEKKIAALTSKLGELLVERETRKPRR